MPSLNQIVTEESRRDILQMLEQDADYSHNENIIQMGLERLGHNFTIDRVRTELRWLQEQGLLEIDDLGDTLGDMLVAKLTRRGQDIAKGRGRVDGIARLRP
jgi:repressor of nif and glnA expression